MRENTLKPKKGLNPEGRGISACQGWAESGEQQEAANLVAILQHSPVQAALLSRPRQLYEQLTAHPVQNPDVYAPLCVLPLKWPDSTDGSGFLELFLVTSSGEDFKFRLILTPISQRILNTFVPQEM